MDEFEVQEGRLRLRRETQFQAHERDGETVWALSLAVRGMAGAVNLMVALGKFSATEAWLMSRGNTHRALVEPSGLYVHAYRPIPGPDENDPMVDCFVLPGGKCYARQIDGASYLDSAPLVAMLVSGQAERVWRELEQHYANEFVPAVPMEVQLERQRQRDYELAEAREQGRAEVMERYAGPIGLADAWHEGVTTGEAWKLGHRTGVENMQHQEAGYERHRATCTCGWRGLEWHAEKDEAEKVAQQHEREVVAASGEKVDPDALRKSVPVQGKSAE